MDRIFFALSDSTRRAIVQRLSMGPATPGELGTPFDISAPAISRHLSILTDAGLIVNERAGKGRICRLVPDPLTQGADWMRHQATFWEDSMQRLSEYLSEGDT